MLKMWKKTVNLLRKTDGAAVVEVSVIVPLLLLLTIGFFCLSMEMIDLASMKGSTMIAAQKKEEQEEMEQPIVMFSKVHQYQVVSYKSCVIAEADISASLPWRGLRTYMKTESTNTIVTKMCKDNRKESMWFMVEKKESDTWKN